MAARRLVYKWGHCFSEDIDLFTHLHYSSIDFGNIKDEISKHLKYVFDKRDMFPKLKELKENFRMSLQVGASMETSIKADLLIGVSLLSMALLKKKESVRFSS